MNPSLNELQRIAELEFSAIIVDSQLVGEKLRLYISDESLIDVWVARKQQYRFGFHWERRHLDGTIYRYDNFPDTDWQAVETFPYHFHDGTVSSQSLGVDETCQVRHAIFLPGKLLHWRT
jgi:hypothetical protein